MNTLVNKFTYDNALNMATYGEKNMYYLYDISKLEEIIKSKTMHYVLTHGGVLGQSCTPSESNHEQKYGLYLPKKLDLLIVPELPIDETLLPFDVKTKKKGYRYMQDIFCDKRQGFHAMMETLLVYWDDTAVRLGKPLSEKPITEAQGVYIPLK